MAQSVAGEPGESNPRREALLAAAASVMSRTGFDRMRLRDVAAEAGVSIGLLQHYFETREQLGRQAFAFVCGERAARFAEISAGAGSAWSRIERCLRYAMGGSDLGARSRVWIELCAAGSRDLELHGHAARVQAAWRAPLLAALESGVASGEFRPLVSAESATDAILALIDGAELQALFEDAPDASQSRVLETAIAVVRILVGAPEND
ncbi:MAG: TetR family transcriptional regulator C-terminal domain-containing protein [Myxococcales bacterium]|nr:TetR family transcriptional regulator C-terminal domain-containing protein [Myxococcales bacterium]MDH5308284.1 TetR family transcriptional regulator C-terminal domain-containing protein [Myxococcales bacterium]